MSGISYEGGDLEVLADMPNYYSWIMETFAPHVSGDVIEYGAGVGTVSGRLAPLADRLTLVEPSANLVSVLHARFAHQDEITIVTEDLEVHSARTAANSVDTVVLVNVLEHIEDDKAALGELVRILKPGGHLLIFVPALEFLMSKLDRQLGHFRRYHRSELVKKARETGASVRSCRYFDLPGVLPWLILNRYLGSTSFNATLVGFNDKVVVPAARLIEKAVPIPFGKNLILVAQK